MDLRGRQVQSKLWTIVILSAIVGLGLGLYIHYTQKIVGGWDPAAYVYAGERIAAGKGMTLCHPFNEAIGPYFTLAGFNVRVEDGACLNLNYPPGLPLLLGAAQLLTRSRDGALYVPALLGALGIVVTFSLGTLLFDRWVGIVGAVVITFSSTYLVASTSPWADLAGTVFVTGGTVLVVWGQSLPMTQERRSMVLATVGGALVVYGIFVRYANVVVLLPIALYFLVSQEGKVFKRSSPWLFGCVVFLGLVGILVFNRGYFGGYLTTGYSPRHGWYTWPAFSLRYALGESPAGGQNLLAVIETFLENFRWLFIPGIVGVFAMPRKARTLLVGSIVSFAVLYGVYAFPAQEINARFLLPAFPALAVTLAYGLLSGRQHWSARDWRWRVWFLGGAILLIITLGIPLPQRLRVLQERNVNASQDAVMVEALVENSEPDAVFLAYGLNDPIFYHGERTTLFYRRMPPFDPVTGTLRWDQLESIFVQVVTELLRRDVPVYYVQDGNPPFANSLEILGRHFVITALETAPPVYRVTRTSVEW